MYNVIGQLTEDVQREEDYIYNSYGLLSEVKDHSTQDTKFAYKYDDKGMRICKIDYTADPDQETWYVNDPGGNVIAIYSREDGSPSSLTDWNIYGMGRLGVKRGVHNIYELSDHLGNVRTTFTKTKVLEFSTGFEKTGELDYLVDYNNNIDNTENNTTDGTNSVVTESPSQEYGSGFMKIPVRKYDDINIEFFYKYTGSSVDAVVAFSLEDAQGNLISNAWASCPVGTGTGDWEFASGCTYTPGEVEPLLQDNEQYYLSIYPFNNDAGNVPVLFDDLHVTITESTSGTSGYEVPQQLDIADYYPLGSVMPGRNYISSLIYRYGFQGQFAEKDPETNMSAFELRMYDGLLGRWKTTDPYGQYHSPYLGMGNDFVNTIDPDGGTDINTWFPGAGSAVNFAQVASAVSTGLNMMASNARQLADRVESFTNNPFSYETTRFADRLDYGAKYEWGKTAGEGIGNTILYANPLYSVPNAIYTAASGENLKGEELSNSGKALEYASAVFPIIRIESQIFKISAHAAERIAVRSIAKKYIKAALMNKPFKYFHDGKWKLGFYDKSSKTFVAVYNGEIKTVINEISESYINTLKSVLPK